MSLMSINTKSIYGISLSACLFDALQKGSKSRIIHAISATIFSNCLFQGLVYLFIFVFYFI